MFYWFKLRYLWVVAAVAVGMVALMLVRGSNGNESSPQPTLPSRTATTPSTHHASQPLRASKDTSVPTEPGSSSSQNAKARLDERVKAFVAAYFSLTPPVGVSDVNEAITLSAAQAKRAVRPYVSAHFMRTATFGYGSSEAGRSLLAAGTARTAQAETGLTDTSIVGTTATGTVMIHYSTTDKKGAVVDIGVIPQLLTLTKQGDTWFVDSAPVT